MRLSCAIAFAPPCSRRDHGSGRPRTRQIILFFQSLSRVNVGPLASNPAQKKFSSARNKRTRYALSSSGGAARSLQEGWFMAGLSRPKRGSSCFCRQVLSPPCGDETIRADGGAVRSCPAVRSVDSNKESACQTVQVHLACSRQQVSYPTERRSRDMENKLMARCADSPWRI